MDRRRRDGRRNAETAEGRCQVQTTQNLHGKQQRRYLAHLDGNDDIWDENGGRPDGGHRKASRRATMDGWTGMNGRTGGAGNRQGSPGLLGGLDFASGLCFLRSLCLYLFLVIRLLKGNVVLWEPAMGSGIPAFLGLGYIIGNIYARHVGKGPAVSARSCHD